MELFADILADAVIDTLRLMPFLFACYLLMEFIEHRAGDSFVNAIRSTRGAGPLVGALLGAFPQCGFSAAASTLYAGRVVSIGTLIAVFLATSDEMLPIFLAEQVSPAIIMQILGAKVAIGMAMGFAVDFALRLTHRDPHPHMHIHEMCEDEHCDCDEDDDAADGGHHHHGVLTSALKHTLQVSLFIFLITFALDACIELVGEDAFAGFIAANPNLSIIASALVGLIPNCAASVIITELYLEGTLGTAAMMSGLLVGAGIGLLVLFRTNRNWRETLDIVLLLLVLGIAWGFVFQLTGITFG